MSSTIAVLVIAVATTGLSRLVGTAAHTASGNMAQVGLRSLQALMIAFVVLLVIFIGLSMFRELLRHDQPSTTQALGLLLVMGIGLVAGVPPVIAGRPSQEY